MKRRDTLFLPALLVPGAARAQARRPRRIGYLHSTAITPPNNALRVIAATWRQAGFVEGRDVFLRAGATDASRGAPLVRELLASDPGVFIAVGAPAVLAAARHGAGVPVVGVDLETDPIAERLAQSFARPGGHVTGLFLDQPSLAAKWLDLLLELTPSVRHVVLLWNPATGPHQRRVAEAAAVARGMTHEVLDPFALEDPVARFRGFDASRTGVVILTSPGLTGILPSLGAGLIAARLPSMHFLSLNIGVGVTMAYGPDLEHYYTRAVPLAERILAGEPPDGIPIERPSRFRFAIDMRVADAIGVSVPRMLLARADEVIE